MTHSFAMFRSKISKKALASFFVLSMLLQSFGSSALIASADVVARVTNASDNSVSSYTFASTTADIAVSYQIPNASSSTPTLDTLQDILISMNSAIADAKTKSPCVGTGSQLVSATAVGTALVDGVSVPATVAEPRCLAISSADWLST